MAQAGVMAQGAGKGTRVGREGLHANRMGGAWIAWIEKAWIASIDKEEGGTVQLSEALQCGADERRGGACRGTRAWECFKGGAPGDARAGAIWISTGPTMWQLCSCSAQAWGLLARGDSRVSSDCLPPPRTRRRSAAGPAGAAASAGTVGAAAAGAAGAKSLRS